MGLRGPPRAPLKVLEARGSWLAKLRQGEPAYAAGLPECPDWLDEVGQAHWRYLEQQVVPSGVATRGDADAMARLCAVRALWQKQYVLVKSQKRISGPALSRLLKLEEVVNRLSKEFGLTPASRSNVTPVEQAGGEDKAEFFSESG